MQKIICKKVYDTETATMIKKFTFGNFGDNPGYEETLYQTQDGSYFIYTNGGSESPYKSEGIKSIAKTKVDEWLNNH